MVHSNSRSFSVAVVLTIEELAEKIAGHKHRWACCQGWLCEGLLFLNDSFSEGSLQEYAVFDWPFPNPPQSGELYPLRELDTWTVDWIEPAKFVAMARELLSQSADNAPRRVTAVIETHDSGESCEHCR